MKTLWFDCETTGLDPVKNSIIQLAGLVEIDGVVKDEFNLYSQPAPGDICSQEALDTHGITIEQMKTFPKPLEMKNILLNIFGKYINKYDKTDKFVLAGQNIDFDISFLVHFFKKQNFNYLGAYLDWLSRLDLRYIIGMLKVLKFIQIPNSKLETIAKFFDVPIVAHDALSDIKATRECWKKIEANLYWKLFEGEQVKKELSNE